ncbi:ABC transporter substrate-binding protein [Pleurocapsa sp. PCC 7319]|uniref:ABC transporter substrate-binding protein n=1 Tax=Pleurocapsa sp. PCC 7319 TaxID=118161 RepID=UPI00034805A7|nr:ABC transporter substrate-binding protein [Pleurocapsa sp. PCC 7319]
MLVLKKTKIIATIVRQVRLAVAFGLFCLLLLSGCNPRQFKSQTARGSQLVLATPSDPATFNFAMNTSAYSIFPFIYKGLVRENAITTKLEPALAESWSISPDQLQITVTLREGLKWSDGKPLTADDVIFTYQDVYLNDKIPTVYRDLVRIGNTSAFPSVEKLDRHRVKFILPEPFAPFLRTACTLAILPAHRLRSAVVAKDAKGNPQFLSTWSTDTNPQKIIGNGPYILESYTPSQRLVFRRNPYYWRSDAQGNPLPYIERLIVPIISSTDNQLLRFRSGDLDSLEINPEMFSLVKREEKRGKYIIYNGGPELGIKFVGFNLNKARNAKEKPLVDPIKSRWFNTLAFRQAVAYAIDRESMKNNIYRGLGELQHSPIAVQSPYYLSPEEGLKVYNYNPQKAKQLLLDSGFQYNSKQELLDWDENKVQFTILVKSEENSRIDAAVQIQQDLSKIGIKADLRVLNFNVVLKKLLLSRDWECYVGTFEAGVVEPHRIFPFWYSGGSFHQFNQGSQSGEIPLKGWEVSDWEQEIDFLFNAGVKELDLSKRKAIYHQFQQIVAEELPVFFLVNPLSFQAVRDRVKKIEFSPLGGAFWNLDELKIIEKG